MGRCMIRDWQGQEAGQTTVDLKAARPTSAVDLMHRAIVRQLAHQRQGTASTLTRAEVRGGGRKPYKQKGTGRARQGSIRTPLRPGGGVVFGPKPRIYSLRMNKKERRLALRTALMARLNDMVIVKGFGVGLDTPKTKEITSALERFGIDKKSKVLIILENPDQAIVYSVRNIEKVKLIKADQLNVFDLLHANKLLISEEALTKIQEVYSDG
ncbi:50S ribosomal protein L4 (chromatophore) [Paulinella micropora]|uniref:Large ribosomal subunit protein uL4c n=1 Tax=Paulinella micropora TaxID=1928728 RepID=A0A1L5YCD1_9EUKA|nr:50S ribosomal protein L4 [Paulinella micropora]AQX45128.1 50S ribosomal protein L4 [Paulinella micropora]BBL86341.1 50S ribosomal protein L4 [Paulinella micropora]